MSEILAWHEAGHCVVAYELGVPIRSVTIEAASGKKGCTFLGDMPEPADDDMPKPGSPLVAWSPGWDRYLSTDAAVRLAGDISADLFGRRVTGRLLPSPTGQLVEELQAEAAFPGLTNDERVLIVASVSSDDANSDAEALRRITDFAHGKDPARAAAWLRWLSEDVRELLAMNEYRVRRLAQLLSEHGTISGRAAVACLERA